MSTYLILLIYLVSFSLVLVDFSSLRKNDKRRIFDLFCIVLLFVSASKSNITSFDTNNYVNYYNSLVVGLNFDWLGWEPGFCLLTALCKIIGLNYHGYFFVITSIVLLLYRYIILKYSDYIFISLFTYVTCLFFLNEIIIIRFGMASAIIFFNMDSLIEGKKKRAFVFNILAVFFHYTALVCFVATFLYQKKKQYEYLKKTLFFMILAIAFFMIIPPFKLIEIVYSNITSDNFRLLLARVMRYKYSDAGSLKRLILYLPNLVLLYFLYKNNFNKNSFFGNVQYVCIIYMICFTVFLVATRENMELGRLSTIFIPANLLVTSNIINCHKNKVYLKYIYLLGIIIIDSYIFVRHIFYNSGGTIVLL